MQYADFDRFLRFPSADMCRITKGNRCGGREEGSKEITIHGISCGRTTGVLGPTVSASDMPKPELIEPRLRMEIESNRGTSCCLDKYRQRHARVNGVLAVFDQGVRSRSRELPATTLIVVATNAASFDILIQQIYNKKSSISKIRSAGIAWRHEKINCCYALRSNQCR